MTGRLVRCPRCAAPVLASDIEHGQATCGTCGLSWPYLDEPGDTMAS